MIEKDHSLFYLFVFIAVLAFGVFVGFILGLNMETNETDGRFKTNIHLDSIESYCADGYSFWYKEGKRGINFDCRGGLNEPQIYSIIIPSYLQFTGSCLVDILTKKVF